MEEKIAVYGLGKMGLPLALVFADAGLEIIGADIDKKRVDMLNSGQDPLMGSEPGVPELLKKALAAKKFRATDDLSAAAGEATIHIILVPTLIRSGKADLSIVQSVCGKIAPSVKKGDIVVTECTMPPGATDGLIPLLRANGIKCPQDFGLAHCPERTMSGTAIRDITGQYPKIIGASDEGTLARVCSVYEKINRKGVLKMPNIREAEAVKIFEGVYRDVNIALANELSLYCKDMAMDSARVFRACNSQPFCHIHSPGYVGGHCIPYYPQFIAGPHTPLINAARKINEGVLNRVMDDLKKGLEGKRRHLKDSRVLLVGLTFRGGVKEFEHSAAIGLIDLLREEGVEELFAMDPLCGEEDGDRFGVAMQKDFSGADAAVILADHAEFREIDWKKASEEMRTRILIDIRNVTEPDVLRENGFWYRILGRYG